MLDLWEDTDDLHDVAPGAISAAAFFSDAGDLRQTARITDIVHTVVAGNDNEENRAARSAVLAETSASVRDWSSAITRFTEARDGYDRLGVPIERALIRRRLVRVMIAAGKEREAVEVRESCAGIARSLGMRSMLASLDVGPGESKPQYHSALTESSARCAATARDRPDQQGGGRPASPQPVHGRDACGQLCWNG
jgi:hypothetical protein